MTESTRGGAAYDRIADWYADYVTVDAAGYTARAGSALRRVLGTGTGTCWDLACGTGAYADTIRELGWTPVGTDVSRGQLRHAAGRLPVVVGDVTRAPIGSASVPAVSSVNCHTDIDDYRAACRTAARVLEPGGRFAHVGLHPCFIGAFADWTDRERVIIRPGYWNRERSFDAWCPTGVRARVGAVHLPLSELLGAVIDAGMVIDEVLEFGEPVPDILAIRAHRG
jgi:SAM-dependent methyltransferase